MEKGDGDNHSHHQDGVPLDWRYGNQMESFSPTPCWDQSAHAHNLNFYESNAPRPDISWNPILMEMASMVGHFGLNQPSLDPYSNPPRPISQPTRSGGSIGGGPSNAMAAVGGSGMQDSKNLQCLGISGNESSEVKPGRGGQEELSSKELSANKRRRSHQEIETDQSKEEGSDAGNDGDESKLKLEQGSSALANAKSNGKHGKEKMDPPKEDYIHVRARRGQATNSHSLAERVRREKISERMKLLQDLVPGCNKVTGKAVMLDEIINYVQSLQQQVEFLSMKLAAINPQINFNIEGLLSKDILQSHAGPSSATGFSTSLVHPLLHQNIQDLVQSGTFGMAAPPDVVRRAVDTQMTAMTVLKDSKPQISDVWERELYSGMQVNFIGSQPLNIQDLNTKSRRFSDVMKPR